MKDKLCSKQIHLRPILLIQQSFHSNWIQTNKCPTVVILLKKIFLTPKDMVEVWSKETDPNLISITIRLQYLGTNGKHKLHIDKLSLKFSNKIKEEDILKVKLRSFGPQCLTFAVKLTIVRPQHTYNAMTTHIESFLMDGPLWAVEDTSVQCTACFKKKLERKKIWHLLGISILVQMAVQISTISCSEKIVIKYSCFYVLFWVYILLWLWSLFQYLDKRI